MGLLIPADYDTRLIDNVTERRVVENLRDRLSDSWYIIPRLDIATAKRPFEVDVLIFHQDYGIAGIEVKGGRLRVDDGEWYRGSDILEPPLPGKHKMHAMSCVNASVNTTTVFNISKYNMPSHCPTAKT